MHILFRHRQVISASLLLFVLILLWGSASTVYPVRDEIERRVREDCINGQLNAFRYAKSSSYAGRKIQR